MEQYLREKRSVKCDMIEKLSLNFKIELPGFDWSKNVGNDFIGASFGVKIVNFVELHLCKLIHGMPCRRRIHKAQTRPVRPQRNTACNARSTCFR